METFGYGIAYNDQVDPPEWAYPTPVCDEFCEHRLIEGQPPREPNVPDLEMTCPCCETPYRVAGESPFVLAKACDCDLSHLCQQCGQCADHCDCGSVSYRHSDRGFHFPIHNTNRKLQVRNIREVKK